MGLFQDHDCYFQDVNLSLKDRFLRLNWFYFAIMCLVVGIGFMLLYSVAGKNIDPYASRQIYRFWAALVIFFVVSLSDLRFWMKYAYILYAITLILLIAVLFVGTKGMGAQRWLNLGFIQLQPSELMKITLILALARYFHPFSKEEIESNKQLIIPAFMMLIPVLFVLKQPDLGTALMLVFVSLAIFFIMGVQYWKFGLLLLAGIIGVPILWHFLHDYQKQRVLTYLNPEQDPFGAGYHIIQSKITLGSGGLLGKGFGEGTQSRLNFIPEKHTDFIFTILAEEFGMVGSVFLIILYMILILMGIYMALKSRCVFGKILALALSINFALYVFINIGMVMGLLPVVGVPLPLVSYGGTAMMVLLFGFGLIQCVYVNQDMILGRRSGFDE